MRKRQDLEARINTVLKLERMIADSTGLIELGEMEGMKLRAMSSTRFFRARPTPMTAMCKSTPARAAPKARIGH
jgi:hypothetical protein